MIRSITSTRGLAVAILIVLALIWADALLGLRALLAGGVLRPHDLEGAGLRSVALLLVGGSLLVYSRARRWRVSDLVVVCSTCYRVRSGGVWRRLEAYHGRPAGEVVLHGICPTCLRKVCSTIDKDVRAGVTQQALSSQS